MKSLSPYTAATNNDEIVLSEDIFFGGLATSIFHQPVGYFPEFMPNLEEDFVCPNDCHLWQLSYWRVTWHYFSTFIHIQ